jgi:hypothetical protein
MTKVASPGLERSARQPHQLRLAVADRRFGHRRGELPLLIVPDTYSSGHPSSKRRHPAGYPTLQRTQLICELLMLIPRPQFAIVHQRLGALWY